MKKLLLIILFSIPSYSHAFSLPTHFGSSLGIKAKSPKITDFKDSYNFFQNGWEIDLQVNSLKFFEDKFQIVTHAEIGSEHAKAGVSFFIKVNQYFYVGGMTTVGNKLDLDHALSATYYFEFNKIYIEPFILFYMKSKKTAGGGVRFYYVNRLALSLGAEKYKEDFNYFVFLEIPVEINLKDLKKLFYPDKTEGL